ncbi:unnamed protein product, partial [Owenia fusiformis]
DFNHNGVVDKEDFDIVVQGLVQGAKWAEGSPMWKRANTMKTNLWEQLKSSADTDKNDQISISEWVDFWAECAAKYVNDTDLPFWYTEYLDVYFCFMDKNGDGWIDCTEFIAYFHGLHYIHRDIVETAYRRITLNEQRHIDIELFREMAIGFTVSKDMKSPGNIMGEMLVKEMGCETEFKRTEFWDKKQRHHFYYWFDQDRNGVVERNDFDESANNILTMTKWSEGSPMWLKCKEVFANTWDELKHATDVNLDDKVTIDEWLNFMENTCKQIKAKTMDTPSWYRAWLDIFFDVTDSLGNADGWIECEEFVSFFRVRKIPDEVSRKCFNEITFDGRIAMDRDYFNLVILQYSISTDMNSPGNIYARMLLLLDEQL